MQMMISDVEKEITESKTEEENAQEEYDALIADSGEKRRMDSQSLSDKESAKADLEKALQQLAKEEKTTKFEVMATAETLKDLHMECDWLLNNFEVGASPPVCSLFFIHVCILLMMHNCSLAFS